MRFALVASCGGGRAGLRGRGRPAVARAPRRPMLAVREPPILYVGTLRAAPSSSSSADAPVCQITAERVTRLVPDLPESGNLSGNPPSLSTALVLASQAEDEREEVDNCLPLASAGTEATAHKRKADDGSDVKSRKRIKVYYVCTRAGCNWTGSRTKLHARSRPSCTSFPCSVVYEPGPADSAKVAVAEYLARCTPYQRELGLAPDYEKPVPMVGPRGIVEPDTLYLTVPAGLGEGDSFRVPTGHGCRTTVTVPTGRVAGDLISLRLSI